MRGREVAWVKPSASRSPDVQRGRTLEGCSVVTRRGSATCARCGRGRHIAGTTSGPGGRMRPVSTEPVDQKALFDSVDDVATRLADVGYIASTAVATTVFLADRLGKPLLVEGPAGVGKTELAKAVAEIGRAR